MTGLRAHPFREFVMKLAGSCNLACTYCYMYEMADQSWRDRPAVMPDEVIRKTCSRIAEHAKSHGLQKVQVVLHGGEPMLAGVERVTTVVDSLRHELRDAVAVELSMQTNATLLSEKSLRALRKYGIRIGVSLDGGREAHDRRRVDRRRSGSYHRAAHGLRMLSSAEHRDAFSGLLCTIDLANDPIEVYEALLAWSPPQVDFLLPHGNWQAPPPGIEVGSPQAPYAAWLMAIFDRWYHAPRRETSVRLFREIIHVILGGQSGTEQIGLSPAVHIVIDTNGSLEQVDSLRSAYDGAAATGLNVLRDSFDDAMVHPDIVSRQVGMAALSEQCRRCSLVRVCGGGNYVHRYRPGSGFRNPSVYCTELKVLIRHIGTQVTKDLRRLRETA